MLALRAVGLLLAMLCAAAGSLAQTASDSDAVDPPARVGSISLLAGPVTLVDLATGSREDAALNWPVTGGWRIDTGRGGRAEVRIGSTALRLDDETTVDFARLDDRFVQIAVLRGSLALRLRNRALQNELEVLTQRERIVFEETGSYRVDVDRPAGLTAVTAFAGRARMASSDSSFVVAGGQRGELTAPPLLRFQLAAALADRFDDWVAARDARDDTIRSAAYVSRETTGIEVLDAYGHWRAVDDYGPVWFPSAVPATWAPYRYGRWAWVSPWGWTWVDEAPWGFAPLHYGRWAVIGGAWGWIPGAVVPLPVYAPALVAWYGTAGVSAGAPIGWFPLGPREVYMPVHRHTPRYLRVVNVQHVNNVEQVTIVQTPRYVHHHPDRSTWVPDDRFGRPDPVQQGRRPPPSEWRQYIARPQPPANVPNTKRRQAVEGASPAVPAAAVDSRPAVRPPSPVPRPVEGLRAVEAPRSAGAPRAVEAPRVQPATPPPAARPEASRRPGEPPAGAREERRMAPRAPAPSMQSPPAFSWPTGETTRPRDASPRPTPAPALETPAPRGRAEVVAPREGQRPAPRSPTASTTMAPPPTALPPQATPPRAAPLPQATPPPAPPAARDATRAPPPARQVPAPRHEGGDDRGGGRGGHLQREETR